jgi:hypothetical protein
MLKHALIALTSVMASPALAGPDDVKVGSTVSAASAALGCYFQEDIQASDKEREKKIETGDCVVFIKGTLLYVEQVVGRNSLYSSNRQGAEFLCMGSYDNNQ